jgi:YD repeat-containing protein
MRYWVGLFSLLISINSFAQVSLKNGNFFVSFTDIAYPGGFDPKIDRVYNSKTAFRGIFGHGWGNEYEVYLTISADGSVIAHEYGGGAENRFSPSAFKDEELTKAVNQITEAASKAWPNAIGNPDNYKKQLKSDLKFRNEEWEKLRRAGKIEPRKLANGTQLHSNKFSYQYITKVADGYVRTFDNGKVEKFDDFGRLIKVSDKNSNFIEIKYGKEGHIEKILDNFNRKMFFSFNSRGLVEKIQGESGKVAEYKYDSEDHLVFSKNSTGETYTFKYDKRHNMLEIGYADKSSMQMTYYPKEQFENIKTVKDKDGSMTEYGYERDAGAGSIAIKVKVKNKDGKQLSESKFEYVTKKKSDGEEWTYKLVTTVDGVKTETTYNECCGLPLLIKQGNEETAFEYDTKGHVTKKTTPQEVTDLKYDPKVNKVSRVARYSKVNKNQMTWSEFNYDPKGNLIFAKNSEKKGVKLLYDNNGRIKTLIDQNRRQIHFKYNENSKPIAITDPSLGTITVSYQNSGEIKKVESTAGRKIALQVTAAFQNLLDIIRPAGVSLSF